MATIALALAGAAAGAALLPAGVSLLGVTLAGATIGSQIGALAGSYVDRALLASSGHPPAQQGPRLSDLRVTASSEGAPIPRLYGRARLGGQIVWATNFEEEVVSAGSGGSGKGGLGGGAATGTEYRYFANFAVALTEGPITGLGRVWADGSELDLSTVTYRLYTGSEDQLPDSLIEAKQGTGNTPAYRGLVYIVFERMALASFGNRIPQLSFEIHRAVDGFERLPRAVCLIPGAGEFVYATEAVSRKVGAATNVAENVHTLQGGTDWDVSLNQLQATLPDCASVSLVVGWFGSDLRAASCQIRPAVDIGDKITAPLTWGVAGLAREDAPIVSRFDGRAAYGGTPSDATVVAAIRDLQDRGLAVTLSPFLFIDVPVGNALTDPYTGAASQPAYPWRGRITVSPAPGQSGSPDKTSAAATQLAAFLGTAAVSDFAVSGDSVAYSGPDEWSYRRFILHYAHLALAAGGVDAFIIGSELRSLTQVRDSASHYPFVAALATLAADVKAVLGTGTKVTYAADWSEYFGHQPADGTGDVYFNLDPLWASAHIDAVGIDVYWPLADWRDGSDHADRLSGALSTYDLAYLRSNIAGGEGYDWYYASPADRDAQVRTPLTLAAVASHPVEETLSAYADVRRRRYRALPTFWRFGKGWLSRVDTTLALAGEINRSMPPLVPPQPKGPKMPTDTQPTAPSPAAPDAKWWGNSMTIQGIIVTTLSTVLPVLGPVFGLNITAELIHQLGDNVVTFAQAAGGLIGTIMAIYGRMRTSTPLERRQITLSM